MCNARLAHILLYVIKAVYGQWTRCLSGNETNAAHGLGEMAWQLGALVALPEDLKSVPGACVVVRNRLQLQFQYI